MEIAIVSDTHLPRGARRLPGECVERLERAELIIHAGDFTHLEVLHELESYGEVVGVQGNVDEERLRRILPTRAIVAAEGVRIGVVHDAGTARGRVKRLRSWFPDVDAVIFGHSHIPLHEAGDEGFQIFNPGSATERRRSPRHTMGVASITAGGISFSLVTLD